MLLLTLIARVRDGLPLATSIEGDEQVSISQLDVNLGLGRADAVLNRTTAFFV